MPELPEVEVLVRHLAPLVEGRTIKSVLVRREKVIRPTSVEALTQTLTGARLGKLTRRGKYLLFSAQPAKAKQPIQLLGHLGMTGRMYLQAHDAPLAKHAAVVLDFGPQRFVFEDTRYFGRFTLDLTSVNELGPEPFGEEFSPTQFAEALKRSSQAIKVKLLDQSVVAGVGNIYASEALHRAGISPKLAAQRLKLAQVTRLHQTVREVLQEAIDSGSTIPLDWAGTGKRDGLFYYGQAAEAQEYYTERLLVYDRAGKPCIRCETPIKRIVQAARSTYFCPTCQSPKVKKTDA